MLWWVVLVTGAAVFLAVAERGIRSWLFPRLLPTGEAHWIWSPEAGGGDGPLAFYAIRDFQLGALPETARILVQADEEYLLLLNGILVGTNRFAPGAPLDVYEVAELLRLGDNRLLAELRSEREDGGFLFHLEMPGLDSERLVSDETWRILPRHLDRLAQGGPLPPVTGTPRLWETPSTGRWGWPRRGEPLPILGGLFKGSKSQPPRRMLVGETAEEWQPAGALSGLPASRPSWTTFDWGREVSGYLTLRFARPTVPLSLVFVGSDFPAPRRDRPAARVVGVAGSRVWVDSLPRRFRFVTVISKGRLAGIRLRPIDPAAAGRSAAQPEKATGVFGLPPLSSRTPVEHEVWREFQGVAGVAGREAL